MQWKSKAKTSGTFTLAGKQYQTADVKIHENYDDTTFDNDIAILVLNEAVPNVTPSSLFTLEPQVDDVLTIVGYGTGGDGVNGDDGIFGVKRSGMVKIDEVLDKWVIWEFDSADEANAGFGDSGGPGFLELDGEIFVASIVSFGTDPDAAFGDMAYNTRIDAYSDWILNIIEADEPTDDPTTDGPTDEPSDEPTDEPSDDPTTDEPTTDSDNRPCNNRPGNRPSGNRRPGYGGNHRRPGFGFNNFRRPGSGINIYRRPGFRGGNQRNPAGNRQTSSRSPWRQTNASNNRR